MVGINGGVTSFACTVDFSFPNSSVHATPLGKRAILSNFSTFFNLFSAFPTALLPTRGDALHKDHLKPNSSPLLLISKILVCTVKYNFSSAVRILSLTWQTITHMHLQSYRHSKIQKGYIYPKAKSTLLGSATSSIQSMDCT